MCSSDLGVGGRTRDQARWNKVNAHLQPLNSPSPARSLFFPLEKPPHLFLMEDHHKAEAERKSETTTEETERRPVVLHKSVSSKETIQLQCSIHGGLMDDPVTTGQCKHVFCRSCLSSWLQLQGHCPMDTRPAQVDQLTPSQPQVEKLNSLLIHCRWGVAQDAETGDWRAVSGEGYCPALVTIGDRKQHEDFCAFNPLIQCGALMLHQPCHPQQVRQQEGGCSGSELPSVNVDNMMQAIKINLSRFERVLCEHMDVFIVQMRSLLEEQNIQRIKDGASGAMTNIKEEMESTISGIMEKQAPLLKSIATKSESLCFLGSSAKAKGSALYEGAIDIGNQAAIAGGEAFNKLDCLMQEIIGEVKQALLRSLESSSCPEPPPPPADHVLVEEATEEEREKEEQEPSPAYPEDADPENPAAWIAVKPLKRKYPKHPPPPPRSAKKE